MEKLIMMYTGVSVYRTAEVHALLQEIRDEVAHNSSMREEFQDWRDVFEKIDAVLAEGKTAGEMK